MKEQETDLTGQVMNKVVTTEKRRVTVFLTVLLIAAGILVVIAVVFLVVSWQLMTDRGAWDMLSLFQEDGEIIAEFWQDTLVTFWEELPQVHLLIAVLAAGALGAVWFLTRRSRKITLQKIRQIGKYQKAAGSPKTK